MNFQLIIVKHLMIQEAEFLSATKTLYTAIQLVHRVEVEDPQTLSILSH